MKLKTTLSLLLLLCIAEMFPQAHGITIAKPNAPDTTTVKINPVFLLLGTLNDYIKHNYGARPNQFDRYYDYEKPLVAFVDSIARVDFKTQFTVEKNAFISEKLAAKMDSLYAGALIKDNLMDTWQKKLSFLTGIYLRYGEKIDNDFYKIQLANSPKNENVYRLLKELGCPRLFYKRLLNSPRQDVFYFQATEPIKKYLAAVQLQNEKIGQALLNALPDAGNARAQYKEMLRKENLKIVEIMK